MSEESYAEAWNKWFDIVEAGASPLTRRMIELAQIPADASVLDLGTGLGEPALTVAAEAGFNGTITALDCDAEMLSNAQTRAHENRFSNIEFICSDIESFKPRTNSFDRILARWSLMFVEDFETSLKMLAASLRADGRLVVATWADEEYVPSLTLARKTAHRYLNLPGSAYGAGSPFCLSDRHRLQQAFHDQGFTDIHCEDVSVRYHYDSVDQYIQNRIELTGPLWPQMQSDRSTREAVFEAISDELQIYRQPDGSIKMDNLAICIAGRIKPA